MKHLVVFLLCVHSALNAVPQFCNVVLYPNQDVTIFVGNTIYYTCHVLSNGINATVNWHINNTVYINRSHSNIEILQTELNDTLFLRIVNVSADMNNTDISCSVRYPTSHCTSQNSKLLLQGYLGKVFDLQAKINVTCSSNGTICVDWRPPFTLNLTYRQNINHYILQVADESSLELIMEITSVTSFMRILSNINPSNATCNTFKISVIPYNDLGAGKTTSIVEAPLTLETAHIQNISGRSIDRNYILFKVHMNVFICNITIQLTDVYFGTDVLLPAKNVEVINNCNYEHEGIVMMNTSHSKIFENRHYDVTYFLSHNRKSTIESSLSTYDIQGINDTHEDVLHINFLENSTAAGALLLIELENINFPIFITLNREESEHINLTSADSNSILKAYDIEENGELSIGLNKPAVEPIHTKFYSTCQNSQCIKQQNISRCHIQTITPMNTITVYCECIESVRTSGYQVLLLYYNDSSGTVYTNSSNCAQTVSVEVEDSGLYYAFAFAIDKINGITGSRAYNIGYVSITSTTMVSLFTPSELAGIIMGAVLIVALTGVLSFIIYYIIFKQKKTVIILSAESKNVQNISSSMIPERQEEKYDNISSRMILEIQEEDYNYQYDRHKETISQSSLDGPPTSNLPKLTVMITEPVDIPKTSTHRTRKQHSSKHSGDSGIGSTINSLQSQTDV